LYVLLLIASSPWLIYQGLRKGKYREGFAAKFLGRVPERSGNAPCLWLHAVSVGEVNLLAPLLAEIAQRRPDWDCVISTTTMTGYALAKKKYAPRTVFYCPLDFSWAVRAAMRRIRPDALVLAELELWPNLIRAAKSSGARVAIVNGRLSEKSARGYGRLRPLVARLLRQIDVIAAQNEEYAERFRALGAPATTVQVTGSMKFDGAQTDRRNANTQALARLARIENEDVVFLAGSTQEPEEALAVATYRTLAREFPRLRLVLVPRHPERFDAVARMLDESGLPWQRRSQLPSDFFARILLVDAVGELGAWWGAAHLAFVGGSLGKRGGQNMIEPAAYGAAVSFGPNTRNFRDIVAQLLSAEAAVVVSNGDELTAFAHRCLVDRRFADRLGERARALVRNQLGATERTFDALACLLEAPIRATRAAA
jgi:3-deoxy-D-manno-octulosonic-acid transferase